MGRARSRRREPIHPIILVHGLLGFATIGRTGRLEYFRGVMNHLENNRKVLGGKGKVYVADLDPTDTIPSRAIQLRDFIQERIYDLDKKWFKYEKVNIIAHSMGGLDARYMISNLATDVGDRRPMADRVASLTTIGTPHLGSPIADFILGLPVGQRLIQLAGFYSINIGAFEQLTREWLVEKGFNERMPDREQVEYFSYAGQVPLAEVFPMLLASALILHRQGTPNDGLVPVESAAFEYDAMEDEYGQLIPVDHAGQIGHGYGYLPFGPQSDFDHLDFYAKLANTLGERGLYFPRAASSRARPRAAARRAAG
jgi:triacylglycerol lipase